MYTQLVERNIELLPFKKILSVSTMTYKGDGNGAAEESLSSYKRLRVGDIAFEGHTSKDFRYGRFVLNDTGDGIMSPRFSALRPISVMPIKFWKYYIHYEPIMKKILVNSTKSGTMMNELVVEEFLNELLLVPEEFEQQKIGRFFNGIDHFITLHQSKSLGHILKTIASRTLYWEQRKLGECFTERIESMPNGELISVTINDGIKKFSELGRHDNSNEDKSKYKKVCIGDIAYNSMRMWQGASGYSPYNGIVSPAYTVLLANEGVNSKCIAYQFKLPGMIHAFQINSQGITSDNWNLKFQALSDITIYISRSIDEQGKIAVLLESLDHLITLHQLEPFQLIFKAIAYRIIDYAKSKPLSSIK